MKRKQIFTFNLKEVIMKKKQIFTLFVVVLVVGLFSGISFAGEKIKVAVAFGGLVTDKSFNEAGYEGLEKAKKEGKISYVYTENVTTDQMEEVIRNYARQGRYDRIIGWGGNFEDTMVTVAKQFPKIQFVVTSSTATSDNLTSFRMDFSGIGYLVGALAFTESKAKDVGVVIGQQLPILEDFLVGIERGRKDYAPEGKLRSTITGSWSDVTKGREAALSYINTGSDIIVACLNEGNSGIFGAGEDKNVKTMSLFPGGKQLAPKTWLGYVSMGENIMMYSCATMQLDGKSHTIGAKEGSLSVILTDLVPQSTREMIDKAMMKMSQ
jgi:basic membrane protein A